MTELLSQDQAIPQYDENHYAVVDLGSNSFHLLITRLENSPSGQTFTKISKVKEKVRLAAGLNNQNILSNEAMKRGLDCLTIFSHHLKSIPVNNILIVATAALRIAQNNQEFFDAAKQILPKPIKLLSGEQEAETIFAGVAHTLECKQQASSHQLVIDIGGASTEIIVGIGCVAKKVVSTNMGCVSFINQHFADTQLNATNFAQSTASAETIINAVKADFLVIGWQYAVSSSGTMQAMVEILTARNQRPVITLPFLQQIQSELIECKTINDIKLLGLRDDRAAVLPSGLSILIALFNCLGIKELCLSSGALREGLLFELAPNAKLL